MTYQQTTLRDALTASFDQVEAGSSTEPAAQIKQETPVVQETPEQKADRVRDEQGRFAKEEAAKAALTPTVQDPLKEEKPAFQRPTTWKKEYLPIWDKLASGTPLTPEESAKLAHYSQQRETEYKSGVSTYKAEAEQAKQLQEAVAPFMATLQQHNIPVGQWINNLGMAHHTLALGTPEQKLQMFTRLAQEYGVPLNMVASAQQGNAPDQATMQLMQELQNLKQQITGVSAWKEQSEQQLIQQEISRFDDTSKYPHFGLVRGNMAQLLESGQAQDLQSAYEMASAPIEDMINQRLEQAKAQHTQVDQKAVAKAKAAAVSPKSSTPSGSVATSQAKDRRSILAEQVDALMGGARV